MPSQVYTRPFQVGRNLELTPGRVVYRSVVFELIQYDETTTRVHRRPLVVVPPQINKYYITDLAPGRRLVESVVAAGILRRKESGADAGRLVADAPLCPGLSSAEPFSRGRASRYCGSLESPLTATIPVRLQVTDRGIRR